MKDGWRTKPTQDLMMHQTDYSIQHSVLRRDSLLVFFAGIAIFTLGLNAEFISSEARHALFAQEMLRNGPSFFPTTYDTPYPDYPATATFLIYLLSLIFGQVTPFAAVLPTAVASALVLVLIYRIGATRARKWAWAAVLLALSTHIFLAESRSIALDQFTSLAAVLCFYLAYSADLFGRYKRLWLIPPTMIAGFLFRGPIGTIVPAGVVCSYYLLRRELVKLLLAGAVAACLLSGSSLLLLAAARFDGGQALAERVIVAQASGRLFGDTAPLFFYFYRCPFALALACPLAILVTIARFKSIWQRKDEDYRFVGYLVAWVLVVMIGLSIAGDKKTRYALPMVPAFSLIAGYLFVDPSLDGVLHKIRTVLVQSCSRLPLLGAVGALVVILVVMHMGYTPGLSLVTALILLCILAAMAGRIESRLKKRIGEDLATLGVGLAAFILIYVGIAQPVSFALETTRPFVEKVKQLQEERSREIVFYRIGPDGEDIKFMVNYNEPIKPLFVSSPKDLAGLEGAPYLITSKHEFGRLPGNIEERTKKCFEGKIGHKRCVVFTMKETE